MSLKNLSKRRDPDEWETMPAMKPKRNTLHRSRHEDPSRKYTTSSSRRTSGRMTEVEQMHEEPLIQCPRTMARNQEQREPIEYYPRTSSQRHSHSRRTYEPPCPIVTMPLTVSATHVTGNQSSNQGQRRYSRTKSQPLIDTTLPGTTPKSPSRGMKAQAAKKAMVAIENEILKGWSDDDSHQEKEFKDFIRNESDWDGSQKTEEELDSRTEATDGVEDYGTSHVDKLKTMSSGETEYSEGTDESYLLLSKQRFAFATITVLAVQVTILLIQLCLCGLASLEINPVIGPYPDAFSEWGGKNAYLLIDDHQYFRLITPAFLHVGVLHFVLNALCTLRSAALFEQEWGTFGWIVAFLLCTVGAVATSCVFDPNEIGVSSSSALMGLIGAKISQLIAYSCFELHSELYLDSARSHLTPVLCNMMVVFMLSFITYIDLSGHIGGFITGQFAGMLLFCHAIKSRCTRFVWAFTGFLGLLIGGSTLFYYLVETHADEELGDACQYFRILYEEGYDCECKWS